MIRWLPSDLNIINYPFLDVFGLKVVVTNPRHTIHRHFYFFPLPMKGLSISLIHIWIWMCILFLLSPFGVFNIGNTALSYLVGSQNFFLRDQSIKIINPFADIHRGSFGDVLIVGVIKSQEYFVFQVVASATLVVLEHWQMWYFVVAF